MTIFKISALPSDEEYDGDSVESDPIPKASDAMAAVRIFTHFLENNNVNSNSIFIIESERQTVS